MSWLAWLVGGIAAFFALFWGAVVLLCRALPAEGARQRRRR